MVGGRTRQDGKARWRRRLDGLAADYRLRIAELMRDEPESARIRALRARSRATWRTCASFALPIVDALAEWPEQATWGDWIDALLDAGATAALRRPDRVLQTLADLRPMSDVGPVSLEEARDVLHDRLVTLDWDPPARRYGRALRRHAASGARPFVPRRVRARPGRARGAAAAARGSAAARRSPARDRGRRWSGRTSAAAPSGCC